jgi:hypothetical protein
MAWENLKYAALDWICMDWIFLRFPESPAVIVNGHAGNAKENYALALIERNDRDGNAHLGELPSDSERFCRGRLRHW